MDKVIHPMNLGTERQVINNQSKVGHLFQVWLSVSQTQIRPKTYRKLQVTVSKEAQRFDYVLVTAREWIKNRRKNSTWRYYGVGLGMDRRCLMSR